MNTTVFAERKDLKKALSSWTSKNREKRLTDIVSNSEAAQSEAKKYFEDELEIPLNEPLLPLHNAVTSYLLDEFLVVEMSKGEYGLIPRKITSPTEEESNVVDTYLQLNRAIIAFDFEFNRYDRFLRNLESKGRTLQLSIDEAKKTVGKAYKKLGKESIAVKSGTTQILSKENELKRQSESKKTYLKNNPDLIACYDSMFTLTLKLGLEKHIQIELPLLGPNEQHKRPHYDSASIREKIMPYRISFQEKY